MLQIPLDPQRGIRLFFLTSPVLLYGWVNGLINVRLSFGWLLTTDVIAHVTNTALCLYVALVVLRLTRIQIGVPALPERKRSLLEDCALITGIGLLAWWMIWNVAWQFLWRIEHLVGVAGLPGWGKLADGNILLVFYFSITAAILEEIYYRGILRVVSFSIYNGKHARAFYILASGLLFGLAHWEAGLTNLVAATFSGFLFARLYLWTSNLYPLMVAHFFVDMVAFY